jgi:hypothetical protein
MSVNIEAISKSIAKGVKSHGFFDDMSSSSEPNYIDRGQMAFSILFEVIGEGNLDQFTAEQGRNFLKDCGFGDEVAMRIINSDDPLRIY